MSNEELIKLYKETKQEVLLEEIINKNYGLIIAVLKKQFPSKSYDEDYIQEGIFGIITAVNKFDLEKDIKFSTYATIWIRQKIFRYYNSDKMIRIPEYLLSKGYDGTIEIVGEEYYINNVIDDTEDIIFTHEALQIVYNELKKINPLYSMIFTDYMIKCKKISVVANKYNKTRSEIKDISSKVISHLRDRLKEIDYIV